MFLVTQLIGLAVINIYSPQTSQTIDSEGNIINQTTYNLPYGVEPPQDTDPKSSLISIAIAIAIAVALILILMKFKADIFIRFWFFFVVIIALSITLNAFFLNLSIKNISLIVLIIAIPLAFLKVFKRNIIIHNITELFIYPGIAAIFVPLLSIWTIVLLLVLISLYDAWAVWHSGIMQKMAKYQMEQVKVFPGFFVPYLNKKQSALVANAKTQKQKTVLSKKKIKIPIAILGGGDVVFPLILAGVVLHTLGAIQALIIIAGSTLALAYLFYRSENGKFYPAMPFITTGALIALGISYLI